MKTRSPLFFHEHLEKGDSIRSFKVQEDTSTKPIKVSPSSARSMANQECSIKEFDKSNMIYIPHKGEFLLMKSVIGYKQEILKQINEYPFCANVLIMMKYRSYNRDFGEYIIEVLKEHDLNGVRADANDWNITRDRYNPMAVIYCCKYGIALFDEPEGGDQAYNANVVYELGIMHAQNKNCLILQHKSLPVMPIDLASFLYVTYERDLEIKNIIARWIRQVIMREE